VLTAGKNEEDRFRGLLRKRLNSIIKLERARGFEPPTPTLARSCLAYPALSAPIPRPNILLDFRTFLDNI
jgi:hypothetical protein